MRAATRPQDPSEWGYHRIQELARGIADLPGSDDIQAARLAEHLDMTIMAVIFDHDGLMVDTEPLQSKAWMRVLAAHGRNPELYPNGLVHRVGRSINENWDILITKYGLTEDAECLENQRCGIYSALLAQAPLAPGLAELLRSLHREKLHGQIRMAIASSSKREYIRAACGHIEHADDFDVIVAAEDVSRYKPAPDIYEKAANELGVAPDSCVVLEDSGPGIESAKAARMKVVAVPSQYTKEHDFSNADIVVPSLRNVDLQLLYSCLRGNGLERGLYRRGVY